MKINCKNRLTSATRCTNVSSMASTRKRRSPGLHAWLPGNKREIERLQAAAKSDGRRLGAWLLRLALRHLDELAERAA